jgi:hypothetical protein
MENDMAHIGATEKVTAISRLSVTASWSGTTPRTEVSNAVYNPPPGWVIKQTETIVHSSNSGNRQVSVIGGGLNLVTEEIFNEVYNAAEKYAAEKNDESLKASITEKRKFHRDQLLRYSSNLNTITAQVRATAHGDFLDRKRGWEDISVIAEIVYLSPLDKSSLAAAIESEFGIDIPNM